MCNTSIKSHLQNAILQVTSHIQDYSSKPSSDFSRNRKLPADKLISFLVAMGSSTTRVELLDFFGLDPNIPSSSAFRQQRAKLSSQAIKDVLDEFNRSIVTDCPPVHSSIPGYRCLAADGSTASFFSTPKFASKDYFVNEGHSVKGFYSIHVNTLYDIDRHLYMDALLQPVHSKNEFRAFCSMVDRTPQLPDAHDIFIGDRGYCSYNNIAHVIEKNSFFLFRAKDVSSKGILHNLDLPEDDLFDQTVSITIKRSNSSKIVVPPDTFPRFVGKDISFDYVDYGSDKVYTITFRVVRVQLSSGNFECLITNLPADEFPPDRLAKLYFHRWQIECSYRDLKYTVGLVHFHSCKPSFIEQEIYAALLMFNFTESIVQSTVIQTGETKYVYSINFTRAVHICRAFLRPSAEEDVQTIVALLRTELIPLRDGRRYKRLQTAHFRKP